MRKKSLGKLRRRHVIAAGLILALVSTAGGEAASLAHRYSFTSDARDSIKGLTGILVDGATIKDGTLVTTISPGVEPGLELARDNFLDLGTSFSIESWYTPAAGPSTYATIFSLAGTFRSPSHSISIVRNREKYPEALPNYAGLSSFSLMDGDAISRQTLLPGLPDQSGELTHIVATYDAETRTAAFYINGQFVSSSMLVKTMMFDLPAVAAEAEFAARVGASTGWNDPSLGGTTSDFRLYRGALNASEVASIYSLGADASNGALRLVIGEPVFSTVTIRTKARTLKKRQVIRGVVSSAEDVSSIRVRGFGAGRASQVKYNPQTGVFSFVHSRLGKASKPGRPKRVSYTVQALREGTPIGRRTQRFLTR